MGQVLELAEGYAKECAPLAGKLMDKVGYLTTYLPVDVLFNPDSEILYVLGSTNSQNSELANIKQACAEVYDGPIITKQAKNQDWTRSPWIKVATSTPLARLSQILHFAPGKYPGGLPSKPSPVAAMLSSGLLGAGLGYGAGWLGSRFLPNDWDRERLPRTLSIVGGLLGAAPGAVWAIANKANDKSVFSSWPMQTPITFDKASEALGDLPPGRYANKIAEFSEGGGAAGLPPVDVDEFNRTIWADGSVANALNPTTKTLATQVVGAAREMPGGVASGLVTPHQMGTLAAGMGSGYATGALAGATLGYLTGMSPKAKDTLKRTGMWAGVVNALVPKLFR